MRTKFAALLAATAVLGVTSAFAANPFSDVTPSDWAYQSVAQLAKAGVINGYPDGTFKGENSITRYEMAQMIAKAMANQHRVDAEQQALINRLANEFSAELDSLGVRVSNLEKRVGNVKATGDVRLRYQGSERKSGAYAYGQRSLFDYRARVQFNASVNDRTDATVRINTGEVEFGDATSSAVSFDLANVEHHFGESGSLTVGRYDEIIGRGLMFDDTFDGARLNIANDRLDFTVSYGHMTAGYYDDTETEDNPSWTILQLKGGNFEKGISVGGFWAAGKKSFDDEVYGFNADLTFGEKVWVGGEWIDRNDMSKASAWVAGIGYGDYDLEEKGTWGVKLQYFNQDINAPVLSSTWNQAYDFSSDHGYKGFMATVDYAIVKNVGLSAYYGFSGEDHDKNDLPDYYRAELNYQF